MIMTKDVYVVGGGAAGFFTAINLAQLRPDLSIGILERGKEVLSKVRISGGGRCNVTHAEFIPNELSKNYPRGERELLGPFHSFMTGDTMAWFEERGVTLKIEEDGRIFPTTDSSSTIINCFLEETNKYDIDVLKNTSVQQITHDLVANLWNLETTKGEFKCTQLVMATGSNPKIWKLIATLGHSIVSAVPSLFTFNIKDERIKDLMGLSTPAAVRILGTDLESEGPLLITHWGMSGPGILKLSAWGARTLSDVNYNFEIAVNWLLDQTFEDALDSLKALKHNFAKQSPYTYAQFNLPKRLWQSFLRASNISDGEQWANLTKQQLTDLSRQLTDAHFRVSGKSTFCYCWRYRSEGN